MNFLVNMLYWQAHPSKLSQKTYFNCYPRYTRSFVHEHSSEGLVFPQTWYPYIAQARLKPIILLLRLLKHRILLKLNYYFHGYSRFFLRPHDKEDDSVDEVLPMEA